MQNDAKKLKNDKLWHMGTHLRLLDRESYSMNTDKKQGLHGFQKSFLDLWTKVSSTLQRLRNIVSSRLGVCMSVHVPPQYCLSTINVVAWHDRNFDI